MNFMIFKNKSDAKNGYLTAINYELLFQRLSSAAAEMDYGKEPGNFDIVIINEDLDDAYSKLKTFLEPEMEKITENTD